MCPSWSVWVKSSTFCIIVLLRWHHVAGHSWDQHLRIQMSWSNSFRNFLVGRTLQYSQVWSVAAQLWEMHPLCVSTCRLCCGILASFPEWKDFTVYLQLPSHSVQSLCLAILYHFLLHGNCFHQLESLLGHRKLTMPKNSSIRRPPVSHNCHKPTLKLCKQTYKPYLLICLFVW